jgi:hypothetical protein
MGGFVARICISELLSQLFLVGFSITTTFDVPMICVQIPICCSYSFASMRGSDRPAIFDIVQFGFGSGNVYTALQGRPYCPHLSHISHTTVIKVEDQDVLRSYADELIHHIGHLGPLYHRADSDPVSVF